MNKYRIINHVTKEEITVEANSAQEAAKKVGYRIKEGVATDIGQPKLCGMTIDQAIENLNLELRGIGSPNVEAYRNSVKLGIEALKAIDSIRKHHHLYTASLLPGETKE